MTKPDKDAQMRGPIYLAVDNTAEQAAADEVMREFRALEIDSEHMRRDETTIEMLNRMQVPLADELRERRAASLAKRKGI